MYFTSVPSTDFSASESQTVRSKGTMVQAANGRWQMMPRDILDFILTRVRRSDLSSIRLTCSSWTHGVDTSLRYVKLTKLRPQYLEKLVSLTSLDLSDCQSRSGSLPQIPVVENLKVFKCGRKCPIDPIGLTALTRLEVRIPSVPGDRVR